MLVDFPKTLVEFDERFGTEAACREYLARLQWPEGFRCPRCGHGRGWVNRRHDIQCRQCGRQTSLTAGTIFAGTRKPLGVWFKAMWWAVYATTSSERPAASSHLCSPLGRQLFSYLPLSCMLRNLSCWKPGRGTPHNQAGTSEV